MAKLAQVELAERLRGYLLDAIKRGVCLEACMAAARAYGKALHEVDCNRIADPELEAALTERFLGLSPLADPEPVVDDLHIASAIYDFGGHTKLLEALAEVGASNGRTQRIVLTRNGVEHICDQIKKKDIPVDILKGGEVERARQAYIAGLTAHCVTLHIHPDDIGGAIAAHALRRSGVRVLFVNHSDHSFSFGTGAANVVLEISGAGWALTHRLRPHEAQSFLGIPIRPLFQSPEPGREKIIATVGSSWKYRPKKGMPSFQKIAGEILDRCPAQLAVVGTDGSEPWWDELKAVHSDRVIFHGRKSFQEAVEILRHAACYIDSVPAIGGTIFSEAAMSGLPVFGLSAGAGGYSVIDAIRYSNHKEMIQAISRQINKHHSGHQKNMLQHSLAEFSRPEAVEYRYSKARTNIFSEIPASLVKSDAEILALGKEYFEDSELKLITTLLQPKLFQIFSASNKLKLVKEILLISGPLQLLRTKRRYLARLIMNSFGRIGNV